MIKRITPIFVAATLLLVGCNNNAPKLNTQTDTLSWAMGESVGNSILSGDAVEIDHEVFLAAVKHTLEGKKQPLEDSVYNEVIQYIYAMAQVRQKEKMKTMETSLDSVQQLYFANLERTNPNVKRHPAGFYYEVLREGKGPKASYAQRIRFDYRSYLMLTNEPFDQTYGKRESIIHVVGNPMFPGLIEAFQLMNAGSLYRFYFPYQLAFGPNGSGSVPGYTPLIYEIELHELYKD